MGCAIVLVADVGIEHCEKFKTMFEEEAKKYRITVAGRTLDMNVTGGFEITIKQEKNECALVFKFKRSLDPNTLNLLSLAYKKTFEQYLFEELNRKIEVGVLTFQNVR